MECLDKSDMTYVLIDTCLLLIPFSAIAIFYLSTPRYRDQFVIRKEMTCLLRAGSLALLMYAIEPLLEVWVGRFYGRLLYGYFVLPHMIPVITLITTAWVLELSGAVDPKEYPYARHLFDLANVFSHCWQCCETESESRKGQMSRQITLESVSQHHNQLSPTESKSDARRTSKSQPNLNRHSRDDESSSDSHPDHGVDPYSVRPSLDRHGSWLKSLRLPGSSRRLLKGLKKEDITLTIMLSDTRGFDAFMQHLFLEFSSENLLCFVEMFQFHAYCGGTVMIETFSGLQFPRNVPKSAIVFEPTVSPADKAAFLCEKYIVAGASFQTNLSHKCRAKILEMYENRAFEKFSVTVPTDSALLVRPFGISSTRNTLNNVSDEKEFEDEDVVPEHRAMDSAGKRECKSNGFTGMFNRSKDSPKGSSMSRIPGVPKGVLYLADVFNDASVELFVLMKDSFSRFRNSSRFLRWFKDYRHSGYARSGSVTSLDQLKSVPNHG